jgi:hypothetical protein
MSDDLYLDNPPSLEKTSGFAARLSEQAENWPQEINSELLKQLPYLSDYDLNVNLDRVESNRGFAFGYADIANKTERPEVEHTEAGLPHIRIPLVVQDRAMKSLATFLDGDRVLPLNEDRVREVLFNPATFDLSVQQPRDPSLVEPLMPPQRSGIGLGGEYKMASANIPLLKAIAPTMDERDVTRAKEKISRDNSIKAGLIKAGAAELVVEVLNAERTSSSDHLQAVADAVEPTAVTVMKLPGGDFLVKQAHVDFFNEKTAAGEVVPGAEMNQAMPDVAPQMQPGQAVTATPPQPMTPEPAPERPHKVVEEFGQYEVVDAMGNSLLGHVFPTTLSWDGTFSEQPIALFTNGSNYALQDTIAGRIVGKATALPDDEPRGDGVFYTVEGGEARATAPITIGSLVAGPDGLPRMMGIDSFGNQVQISQVDGLDAPMRVSDIEMALPKSWKFMRLNNQTQLQGAGMSSAGGPEDGMTDSGGEFMGMGEDEGAPKKPSSKKPTDKKSSDKKPEKKEPKSEGGTKVEVNVGEKAKKEKTSAVLFYNGSFNFAGGCGLEKISRDLTQDLDPVSAEFLLAVLGVDGATAKMKVAEARKKGMVKLSGLKTITTLGERYSEAVKTASALATKMPDLKRDLIKEAAEIADEGTVDNLLALNFINPENLSTFVGYLPKLEETSERLAEMLLYSQLGMNEVPESAVERSMKGMEEVITGLKGIAQTQGA